MFNKKQEQVKCDFCRHYIDRSDTQVVRKDYLDVSSISTATFEYYCPLHKVPYSKVLNIQWENSDIYLKEFSVDRETGEPIGYQKIVQGSKSKK